MDTVLTSERSAICGPTLILTNSGPNFR